MSQPQGSVRGPDQLSGELKTRVREGPVATSEDLALCSCGRSPGWLGAFTRVPKSVPLATALKTAEASSGSSCK